jgi:hypothetical protein
MKRVPADRDEFHDRNQRFNLLTQLFKMKIRISFFFIILFMASYTDAKEVFTPSLYPNLTYQIRYGFMVGGITTLSLNEGVYKDKLVYHALAIGQTTGMADNIYGVKDIYESWFDKETNLPYKQIRKIKEGRYTQYNEVTYNRENNTVDSKLSGIHSVPAKILDLSSTFYYIRRLDFSKVNEGDAVSVNMYFSDEIFPFHLIYKGKETIKTKFGSISCIKISPLVEVGRMFKAQDDLTIWFTDDANRLPVLVRMDIRIVGSVYLKLIEYKNNANPLMFQR